jgi:hypothetical protein
MPLALRQGRDRLPQVVGLLSVMILMLGGCANDPPRPAATVTPDHVRGHSDKAFEKLKQEDQHRAVDPAVVR